MRQLLQSIDKWVAEFSNESEKTSVPLEDTVAEGKTFSTIYNNIGNRIANNKAQIRSRKTFSFRSFVNSSVPDGVLR